MENSCEPIVSWCRLPRLGSSSDFPFPEIGSRCWVLVLVSVLVGCGVGSHCWLLVPALVLAPTCGIWFSPHFVLVSALVLILTIGLWRLKLSIPFRFWLSRLGSGSSSVGSLSVCWYWFALGSALGFHGGFLVLASTFWLGFRFWSWFPSLSSGSHARLWLWFWHRRLGSGSGPQYFWFGFDPGSHL